MRKTTPESIVKLQPNEVFVFGSNESGFHGAGASGFACRDEYKSNWREDQWFLNAMKSPKGSPDRIGKWAVYGVSQGLQEGKMGKSYAIITIKKPGLKRSVSLEFISNQILELKLFAIKHTELTFLVTKIGCALAGYSIPEIKQLFMNIPDLPDNIILPKEFEFRS